MHTDVRREIRSLTSDDREAFLKALQIIYSTTDVSLRMFYF